MITINPQLLKAQIELLLKSDMNEDAKSGLHNLLGEILDALRVTDVAVLFSTIISVKKGTEIEKIVAVIATGTNVLQDFINKCHQIKNEKRSL